MVFRGTKTHWYDSIAMDSGLFEGVTQHGGSLS